jgi:hypothetical protein
MKRLFAGLLIALCIFSCKKEHGPGKYTGAIVNTANGCSIPPRSPYKIKFDDITLLDENNPMRKYPELDSSCIADIPDEFKIICKMIRFDFRELNEDDRVFTCDGNVAYHQVVLCNISNADN